MSVSHASRLCSTMRILKALSPFHTSRRSMSRLMEAVSSSGEPVRSSPLRCSGQSSRSRASSIQPDRYAPRAEV